MSIGLVIVLSAIPDAAPEGSAGIDKFWHALAYMARGFGGTVTQAITRWATAQSAHSAASRRMRK